LAKNSRKSGAVKIKAAMRWFAKSLFAVFSRLSSLLMASEKDCISAYQQLLDRYALDLKQLERKKSRLAYARLLAIVAVIACLYGFLSWQLPLMLLPMTFFIAVFLRLVVLDVNNGHAIDRLTALIIINKEEINYANRKFSDQPDGAWLLGAHPYAADLDIFGSSSLYQYLNRTATEQGNELMAEYLLHHADPTTIHQRQAAVSALAPMLEWRQELQFFGRQTTVTKAGATKLTDWCQSPNLFAHQPIWKLLRWIFPLLSISVLVLYIYDVLNFGQFSLAFSLFFIVAYRISNRITPMYLQLGSMVKEMQVLNDSILHIEQTKFSSELLQQTQALLQAQGKQSSVAIRQLKGILGRLDYRLNVFVHFFLNSFLLWDLHQAFQLEAWKQAYREWPPRWYAVLAKMEVWSSMANLQYNHPAWAFPVLAEGHGHLKGLQLGHPLIAEEKRVCSDFNIEGNPQLALITGSNMAGKSTFLRTIGLNMVLANMGAPCCAQALSLSSMRIVSTMRIADNLEEQTSTFYAELKKLKYIIECVRQKEKVFLLMDEILRGTNSLDRHTGSKAFIQQLLRNGASGLLATHDLELAKLADDFPGQIQNYHFDVQVANEELFFDYQLKNGICQSLNASILMKKIGIELN
jgi:hypothetical protein